MNAERRLGDHQMQRGLILDVVVRKCAAIFQNVKEENQVLLIWRNALLVLNIYLDVVNRVIALYIQ
eukprot:3927274-Karenia_brevis.AAC.1